VGSEAEVEEQLAAAERALSGAALAPGEIACFQARLLDQRAFQHNQRGDHAAALALYRSLPEADVHPFASYRRDAGLAFGYLRAGQADAALLCARRACDHAGDGGYTRLRVMALLMIARIEGPPAAGATLARARVIAERLEDEELLSRVDRVTRQTSRAASP
jgi:hypothetical protein